MCVQKNIRKCNTFTRYQQDFPVNPLLTVITASARPSRRISSYVYIMLYVPSPASKTNQNAGMNVIMPLLVYRHIYLYTYDLRSCILPPNQERMFSRNETKNVVDGNLSDGRHRSGPMITYLALSHPLRHPELPQKCSLFKLKRGKTIIARQSAVNRKNGRFLLLSLIHI